MQATYRYPGRLGGYPLTGYQSGGTSQAILFGAGRPEAESGQHLPAPRDTPVTVIALPFSREGDAALTLALRVEVEAPTTAAGDPAARVLALRAWLDSLPPVPPIPLEALDRGNLY
jgi:hypothetical protein